MALNVCFMHPDLGIGGAERLVVDAAMALSSLGHSVSIATSHHDNSHCFDETRTDLKTNNLEDKKRLQVVVHGDFMPRSIVGRCKAMFAYLRMIYLAFVLCFKWHWSNVFPDVIIVDQISACIPILRLLTPNKTCIIFYCHFPDLLLSKKSSWLKSLYRMPIDAIEEVTTGMAHTVLVNSKFTSDVFRRTFSGLHKVTPLILYPAINTKNFDLAIDSVSKDVNNKKKVEEEETYFLSINRFERKKNLGLAIKAFGVLRSRLGRNGHRLRLVMAGGYDLRMEENVEHASELEQLAFDLNLSEVVTFMRSPSDAEKVSLLLRARALIYTPSEEHFGIVPLEAMYCRLPVVAVNNGGPLETVVNGQTGFLCDNTTEAFADAMWKLVNASKEELNGMGQLGRKRVCEKFSFNAFKTQLNEVVEQTCQRR